MAVYQNRKAAHPRELWPLWSPGLALPGRVRPM